MKIPRSEVGGWKAGLELDNLWQLYGLGDNPCRLELQDLELIPKRDMSGPISFSLPLGCKDLYSGMFLICHCQLFYCTFMLFLLLLRFYCCFMFLFYCCISSNCFIVSHLGLLDFAGKAEYRHLWRFPCPGVSTSSCHGSTWTCNSCIAGASPHWPSKVDQAQEGG